MTVKQNFKIRTGIRILLTSGLVVLALLFVISCQATPPTEEETAPTSTEIKEQPDDF